MPLPPLPPILVAASAALAACGSDGERSSPVTAALLAPDAATIVYRHRDGSIPPPDYRERALTVTPESSRLVTGDRDSTLSDESVATDLSAVERTLDLLAASDLPAVLDEGDCVGGPLSELEVTDASDVLVREVRVVCPGERRDAGAELREIVAPLLGQFDGMTDDPDGRAAALAQRDPDTVTVSYRRTDASVGGRSLTLSVTAAPDATRLELERRGELPVESERPTDATRVRETLGRLARSGLPQEASPLCSDTGEDRVEVRDVVTGETLYDTLVQPCGGELAATLLATLRHAVAPLLGTFPDDLLPGDSAR